MCVPIIILEKKYRRNKQETEETGYLCQVGGKEMERRQKRDR